MKVYLHCLLFMNNACDVRNLIMTYLFKHAGWHLEMDYNSETLIIATRLYTVFPVLLLHYSISIIILDTNISYKSK